MPPMVPKPPKAQPTDAPSKLAPKRVHPPAQSSPPFASCSSSSSDRASMATRQATEQYAQAVHLVEGFADTLDAIPPSLTRSLSDLKELDAVLNTPLLQVHSLLDRLLASILQPDSMRPDQRLALLRSVVGEIEKYKLGGEDKIRVANGTCETLSHYISQLDTTMALLVSSLPQSLEGRIPDSTLPTGYPRLTGSLRSKPSGRVWGDTVMPSNFMGPDPYISAPMAMPTHEFVNFDVPLGAQDHESSFELNHKRPKLLPTASSSHLGHSQPSSSFHGSPKCGTSESGSILDQHMSMLTHQQVNKRRVAREDADQKPSMGSRGQKSNLSTVVTCVAGSGTTDPKSWTAMLPNQSVGSVKTKRPRTTTNNTDDSIAGSTFPIANPTQPPPKKRVRKTNVERPNGPGTKSHDSQPPTLPSTPVLQQYPTLGLPNGKRHPTGASPALTGSPTASTSSKRAYTKRANPPARKRPKPPTPDAQVSEPMAPDDDARSQDSSKIYCICDGQVIAERMVACDNATCPIEWFHYQCAGLTEDPTGSWFCSECKSKGYGSPHGQTPKPERETASVQLERIANNHGKIIGAMDQVKAAGHLVWEGQMAINRTTN